MNTALKIQDKILYNNSKIKILISIQLKIQIKYLLLKVCFTENFKLLGNNYLFI